MALLPTLLRHGSSFLNSDNPSISAVASSKGHLLVWDGRALRLYAGTEQIQQTSIPADAPGATLAQLHYNACDNNFVLVYSAAYARFVSADMTMHEIFNTGQSTIVASAWLERRQELVTTSKDGSLSFSQTRKNYTVLISGRKLIPTFKKRMAIKTTYRWMVRLAVDEEEDRLFVLHERDVLVWSCATGELLQKLSSLGEHDLQGICYLPGSRRLLTTCHDGVIHKWAIGPSGAVETDVMTGHAKRVTAMAPAAHGRLLVSCSEDDTMRVWSTESCAELHECTPTLAPDQSQKVSDYTAPHPSLIALSEQTSGNSPLIQLHVLSGALITSLELLQPSARMARASDVIRTAHMVESSRERQLGQAERMLLLHVANNTLQLVAVADGNVRSVFAPRRASSSKVPGSGPVIGGTVYEPDLGCAIACCSNGAVDVLEIGVGNLHVGAAKIPEPPPEVPGMPPAAGSIVVLWSFHDPNCAWQAVTACLLPTALNPSGQAVADRRSQKRADELLSGYTIVTGGANGYLSLWHVHEANVVRTVAAHIDSAVVAVLPLRAAPKVHAEAAGAPPASEALPVRQAAPAVPMNAGQPAGQPVAKAAHALQASAAPAPELTHAGLPEEHLHQLRMFAGAGAGAGASADEAAVDGTPVAKKAWLRTGKAVTYVAAEDSRFDSVVVSVAADGSVRLYDTSGFKFTQVGAFNVGSAYEVTAAALRSARTLLVGFENGTVELWQLPDWRETGTSRQRRAVQIGSLLTHAGRITSFSCTKDLRYFLTSSADSTVVMWNLARFTPVHTFSFSKPAAHALSLSTNSAFLTALGDGMEEVPFASELLPPPVDFAILSEADREFARRVAEIESQEMADVAQKALDKAALLNSVGVTATSAAAFLGPEFADDEFFAALDRADAQRGGTRVGPGADNDASVHLLGIGSEVGLPKSEPAKRPRERIPYNGPPEVSAKKIGFSMLLSTGSHVTPSWAEEKQLLESLSPSKRPPPLPEYPTDQPLAAASAQKQAPGTTLGRPGRIGPEIAREIDAREAKLRAEAAGRGRVVRLLQEDLDLLLRDSAERATVDLLLRDSAERATVDLLLRDSAERATVAPGMVAEPPATAAATAAQGGAVESAARNFDEALEALQRNATSSSPPDHRDRAVADDAMTQKAPTRAPTRETLAEHVQATSRAEAFSAPDASLTSFAEPSTSIYQVIDLSADVHNAMIRSHYLNWPGRQLSLMGNAFFFEPNARPLTAPMPMLPPNPPLPPRTAERRPQVQVRQVQVRQTPSKKKLDLDGLEPLVSRLELLQTRPQTAIPSEVTEASVPAPAPAAPPAAAPPVSQPQFYAWPPLLAPPPPAPSRPAETPPAQPPQTPQTENEEQSRPSENIFPSRPGTGSGRPDLFPSLGPSRPGTASERPDRPPSSRTYTPGSSRARSPKTSRPRSPYKSDAPFTSTMLPLGEGLLDFSDVNNFVQPSDADVLSMVALVEGDWVVTLLGGHTLGYSCALYGMEGAREKALARGRLDHLHAQGYTGGTSSRGTSSRAGSRAGTPNASRPSTRGGLGSRPGTGGPRGRGGSPVADDTAKEQPSTAAKQPEDSSARGAEAEGVETDLNEVNILRLGKRTDEYREAAHPKSPSQNAMKTITQWESELVGEPKSIMDRRPSSRGALDKEIRRHLIEKQQAALVHERQQIAKEREEKLSQRLASQEKTMQMRTALANAAKQQRATGRVAKAMLEAARLATLREARSQLDDDRAEIVRQRKLELEQKSRDARKKQKEEAAELEKLSLQAALTSSKALNVSANNSGSAAEVEMGELGQMDAFRPLGMGTSPSRSSSHTPVNAPAGSSPGPMQAYAEAPLPINPKFLYYGATPDPAQAALLEAQRCQRIREQAQLRLLSPPGTVPPPSPTKVFEVDEAHADQYGLSSGAPIGAGAGVFVAYGSDPNSPRSKAIRARTEEEARLRALEEARLAAEREEAERLRREAEEAERLRLLAERKAREEEDRATLDAGLTDGVGAFGSGRKGTSSAADDAAAAAAAAARAAAEAAALKAAQDDAAGKPKSSAADDAAAAAAAAARAAAEAAALKAAQDAAALKQGQEALGDRAQGGARGTAGAAAAKSAVSPINVAGLDDEDEMAKGARKSSNKYGSPPGPPRAPASSPTPGSGLRDPSSVDKSLAMAAKLGSPPKSTVKDAKEDPSLSDYDKWRRRESEHDADWHDDGIDWDDIDFKAAPPEMFDALISDVVPEVHLLRREIVSSPTKEGAGRAPEAAQSRAAPAPSAPPRPGAPPAPPKSSTKEVAPPKPGDSPSKGTRLDEFPTKGERVIEASLESQRVIEARAEEVRSRIPPSFPFTPSSPTSPPASRPQSPPKRRFSREVDGLAWVVAGQQKPTQGAEVVNAHLSAAINKAHVRAAAMQHSTSFGQEVVELTQPEMDACHVSVPLEPDSFVKVGNKYYIPADTTAKAAAKAKLMVAQSRAEAAIVAKQQRAIEKGLPVDAPVVHAPTLLPHPAAAAAAAAARPDAGTGARLEREQSTGFLQVAAEGEPKRGALAHLSSFGEGAHALMPSCADVKGSTANRKLSSGGSTRSTGQPQKQPSPPKEREVLHIRGRLVDPPEPEPEEQEEQEEQEEAAAPKAAPKVDADAAAASEADQFFDAIEAELREHVPQASLPNSPTIVARHTTEFLLAQVPGSRRVSDDVPVMVAPQATADNSQVGAAPATVGAEAGQKRMDVRPTKVDQKHGEDALGAEVQTGGGKLLLPLSSSMPNLPRKMVTPKLESDWVKQLQRPATPEHAARISLHTSTPYGGSSRETTVKLLTASPARFHDALIRASQMTIESLELYPSKTTRPGSRSEQRSAQSATYARSVPNLSPVEPPRAAQRPSTGSSSGRPRVVGKIDNSPRPGTSGGGPVYLVRYPGGKPERAMREQQQQREKERNKSPPRSTFKPAALHQTFEQSFIGSRKPNVKAAGALTATAFTFGASGSAEERAAPADERVGPTIPIIRILPVVAPEGSVRPVDLLVPGGLGHVAARASTASGTRSSRGSTPGGS